MLWMTRLSLGDLRVACCVLEREYDRIKGQIYQEDGIARGLWGTIKKRRRRKGGTPQSVIVQNAYTGVRKISTFRSITVPRG